MRCKSKKTFHIYNRKDVFFSKKVCFNKLYVDFFINLCSFSKFFCIFAVVICKLNKEIINLTEITIMKKSIVICAGLCVVLAFTSCGTKKESMYKKAYEKAKASESTLVAEPVVEAPVVTPLEETPVTKTPVVSNSDNVSVRTEDLSVIDGPALKNYSVVVGSFGLKANAEGLAKTLRAAGYQSRIAFNSGRNMYRVVATSFDSKSDAVSSRDQLRSKYPDAWLLFQK